ncbi:MAG: hypothetical protein CVU49_00445 [Candidatus Cloacimonetes bacterium HGW-Cloacimonetes-2]|nr:MAG: hypothetical protein CVU49_00445 [Candidatus Cloacimonetes bacterium HGW-Cloacimonetes-2]
MDLQAGFKQDASRIDASYQAGRMTRIRIVPHLSPKELRGISKAYGRRFPGKGPGISRESPAFDPAIL